MGKLIFTVLVMLLAMNAYSQVGQPDSIVEAPSPVVLGPYKWKVKVLMEKVDITGTVINPSMRYESESEQLFDAIAFIGGDDVLIKISKYSKPDEASARLKYTPETDYFKVSKEFVQNYAVRNTYNTSALAFGLLNFPFKYRVGAKGKGDFTGAFNFGAAIGFTFKKRSYKRRNISFLTGYSISNLVLDKSQVRRNETDLTETNNYTSFSFSFGPMIEYSRVQAGLFLGFDFLNRVNQDHFGWRNQGKPWFSIGFGYAIFAQQGEKKESSGTN